MSRIVTLDNPKLHQLVYEKSEMILEGIKVTDQIESVERDLKRINLKIKKVENGVDVKDFDKQGQVLKAEALKIAKQIAALNVQIHARYSEAVPKELIQEYRDAEKKKEELESQRNKIGLKVQKWKDKIIPLSQKVGKPYLEEEFEDFNTVRIQDGKVVLEIFSHLEEFKQNFRERNKK